MGLNLSSFKAALNTEQLEQMEKEYKQNQGGSFQEIPTGIYPVELSRMEVGKSAWGTDQINISFKVTDGQYQNQLIFYNGTFDTHFAHGAAQTARLISEMTDGELDEDSILFNLTRGTDNAANYITDLYQALAGAYAYDLDYKVQTSNKTNPNTGKPYINKFYSIAEVFDI